MNGRGLVSPADRFRAGRGERFRAQHGIGPLAIHASYLVNLAGPDEEFHERSVAVLTHELRTAQAYGAAFINVSVGGWDLHDTMFDTGRGGNFYVLMADLDRALYNFVIDLKASGDFDSTLIVLLGEFGRTPGNLNSGAGRDHFLQQAVLMAGGGIQGGRVLGSTDRTGNATLDSGWSRKRDIRAEDVEATIYSALGIDYGKELADPSGRGFQYVPFSDRDQYGPIHELW